MSMKYEAFEIHLALRVKTKIHFQVFVKTK